MDMPTFWNGLPADAVQGEAIVANAPQFRQYWARRDSIVGKQIAVVQVEYRGQTYYLDNRSGSAWIKVTQGRGLPNWPHRSVEVEPDSFMAYRS